MKREHFRFEGATISVWCLTPTHMVTFSNSLLCNTTTSDLKAWLLVSGVWHMWLHWIMSFYHICYCLVCFSASWIYNSRCFNCFGIFALWISIVQKAKRYGFKSKGVFLFSNNVDVFFSWILYNTMYAFSNGSLWLKSWWKWMVCSHAFVLL